MDMETALLVNLIIGAASFVSSLTGFGYALVATPFMVLLFPPQVAVPVVLISWIPLASLLVREAYGRMQFRRIGRWLVGAVMGVPVGVYGLASIDEGIMRGVIGGITLMAALVMWFRPGPALQKEGIGAGLVGLLSGVMGGASGMSGPPVILFGLKQGWNHLELRANLIGYFVLLHMLTIVLLREFDVLGKETAFMGVTALPGIFVGYLLGIRLKDRVSQNHFRILAFALVCLGGLLVLIRH